MWSFSLSLLSFFLLLHASWLDFTAGTAVALAGVFLYSRAKRIKPKPKAAWVCTENMNFNHLKENSHMLIVNIIFVPVIACFLTHCLPWKKKWWSFSTCYMYEFWKMCLESHEEWRPCIDIFHRKLLDCITYSLVSKLITCNIGIQGKDQENTIGC